MVDRRLAVRWLAPAAFLLAVTGVVLVVRSGLRSHGPTATTTAPALVTTTAKASQPAAVPKQWYVIQSGDTLGAIAARFGTSVEALLRLNPGIEPTTLRPGRRVRVK